MTQETGSFACGGGLDLVTPAIRKSAGSVIGASNYEPKPEGYRRIDGYERYDGHTQPHAASYWLLNFDAGTAAISEGDIVDGATSGAQGEALVDAVVTSGSWATNDAAGYLVLTGVSGTFQDNESLEVSAAAKSTVDGTATGRGATNDTDDATWIQDAEETARSDITAVPGTGAVRGVWRYNNKNYAFRDNVGATACVMHVESTSGWTECDLGYEIDFTSGGTTEIAEDDTITGDVSGATATVKRVIVTSGTWAGGDAAGRLIIYSQTGTFQAENLLVSAVNLATVTGDSTANAFQPGGRFEFRNHNFYGASDLKRMYGVDGVSKGFEWDGSVFVFVKTGMTTDTPKHLAVHKQQLFYAFPGGSAQHSGPGAPFDWTPILGAAEIGMGADITAYLEDVAGVMLIYSADKISVLYGNDSTDWDLRTPIEESGALAWTVQRAGRPVCFDGTGITDLATTQAYGDFILGGVSQFVEPWIRAKRLSGATIKASLRVRDKGQYRLFWDDKTALYVDVSGKRSQIMTIDLEDQIECTASVRDDDGEEWLLFGDASGFVHRMDKGTGFDGTEMPYYLRFPFNHFGTPAQNKRWHKITAECDAGPTTDLNVSAEYGYGSSDLPPQLERAATVKGGGGFFNEASWNEFYWSSQVEGLAEAHISGVGANISSAFAGAATYEQPHTIHGVTTHYSKRGLGK